MSNIKADAIEIDLVAVEDDTLFSDNEHVAVEKVNFEFVQSNESRGLYRKISVFNDTHCHITIQNKHQRKHKYRVDIAYLDPTPVRQRRIAWKWLYACLALLALVATLFISNAMDTNSIAFLGLVVGIVVVAVMTLIGFFYYSSDRIFFRSKYGKIRLLEFINGNPNKALFREFISTFVRQIETARAAKHYDTNQILARELREIRRLHEEKVVPKASYERAKQRIFKHPAFSGAA